MDLISLKTYIIPSNIEKMCCTIKVMLKDIQAGCNCISEDTLFELKVILNELLSNAIKHGNKMNELKKLKVVSGLTTDSKIFFVIQDEGEGFDCSCNKSLINSPDSPCFDFNDLKETGRGIYIVRELCDRVIYNEKGNKVIVIKKI